MWWCKECITYVIGVNGDGSGSSGDGDDTETEVVLNISY